MTTLKRDFFYQIYLGEFFLITLFDKIISYLCNIILEWINFKQDYQFYPDE